MSIEERTRDRVLLYQVDTPIMTEDPYLAVTIEVSGTRYDGEYVPWQSGKSLPLFWNAGDPVQVRIEKHFFYLKRPDGGETKFEIVHRGSSKSNGNSK